MAKSNYHNKVKQARGEGNKKFKANRVWLRSRHRIKRGIMRV